MRTKVLITTLALSALVVATLPAQARHYAHHYWHAHHHWHTGSFNCGRTQAAHFGLSAAFNLALHWAILPHTSAHPGAVVVQRRAGRALGGGPGGHVSRIVSIQSHCRAIVTDNVGTYSRDICRNLVAYVSPR
jgi:hypothetical protein